MAIEVYSKPNCVQCDATYKALEKHGLEFTTIDLSSDPDALAMVKGLGYQSAPVVMADGEHWAGFRPDRIKQTAAKVQQGIASAAVGGMELSPDR